MSIGSELDGGSDKLTTHGLNGFCGNNVSVNRHVMDISVCINHVEHGLGAETAVGNGIKNRLEIDAAIGKESLVIKCNIGISTLNHANGHALNSSCKSIGLSGIYFKNYREVPLAILYQCKHRHIACDSIVKTVYIVNEVFTKDIYNLSCNLELTANHHIQFFITEVICGTVNFYSVNEVIITVSRICTCRKRNHSLAV